MELHELEVGHVRARVARERDTVARRDRWIGRLAKHLAGAAGGEQNARARICSVRAVLIEEADARRAAVRRR